MQRGFYECGDEICIDLDDAKIILDNQNECEDKNRKMLLLLETYDIVGK